MKTTIELPDPLLRRAKQAAIDRGTTLKALIEEALVKALGPAIDDGAPLRIVTWPPAGPEGKRIGSNAVLRAIRRERDGDPVTRAGWLAPSRSDGARRK
ncbi:MAG: CopG family transcriptional regulator [Lautropia sp.]